MSENNRRWVANGGRQRREATLRKCLFDALGRQCSNCGSRAKLTFDCVTPCEVTRRGKQNSYDRIKFFTRQHGLSNVRVLCGDCKQYRLAKLKYESST